MMSEGIIRKYDKNGRRIYKKESYGIEFWWEYDENGRNNYHRNTAGIGLECWIEHDENNMIAYYKNCYKDEKWLEYTEDGIYCEITTIEYNKIEGRGAEKEFLSRKEVPRFELMEL